MSEPIIIAMVVAIPPTLAAIIGFIAQRRKIDQIHVLVNDRLDRALTRIERLQDALNSKEVKDDTG